MSMYHVKSDGAMGRCTAKEGHCPFGGDSGVKHFTSITEAQAYAEKMVKNTTDGGMKMTKTKTKDEESPMIPPTDNGVPKENTYGLAVTTYPTTEHGVHWAAYPGWVGDDVIINAGGYVDGVYFDHAEVESFDLYEKLSEDVRDEMEPLRGGWPGDWNGKIIELKGNVSPRDEELLEALWISGEVYNGEVTVYGTDDVSEMNEGDFRRLGLDRVPTDEDDEEESPMGPTTDDDAPSMKENQWGLKVTTWPTEEGVHSASYLGWGSGDDYDIINAGGWVDGKYISPSEVWGLAGLSGRGLYDRLSEDVRAEMDSLDGQGTGGATPVEWNGKILELEKSGRLSDEDEELLDALWIEAEAFEGSVTIYGLDDDVAGLDEDDLKRYGLRRLDADELWRYGVLVDDDDDATEDEDE